jgi:tripartite-type tricarboxylate transporter receptor subunit TctC
MKPRALVAALALALPLGAALAQTYPAKPLRIVAPQPPGGAYDYYARLLGERFQAAFGQPAVVDNKAGAATILGTDAVAKAAPDGYTLLVTTDTHVVLPALHKTLPYDAMKDFQPVSLVANVPFVLVVSASSPIASLKDYVAAARAKPNAVSYGSSGIGGALHLAGELFKSSTGVELLHVPYKGMAAVSTAILANEITSAFAPLGPVTGQLRAGKLRPLVSLSQARSPLLPDVPGMADEGVKGFEFAGWVALLAPAGTPRPVVDRLNGEVTRAVRDPQFAKERILSQGYEPVGSTPERLGEVMRADAAKMLKVVRDANIPPE